MNITMESEHILAFQKMVKVLDLQITNFLSMNTIIEDVKTILRKKEDYHNVDRKKFASYLYGKYGKDHPEIKVDFVWKSVLDYAIEDLDNESKIGKTKDRLASSK